MKSPSNTETFEAYLLLAVATACLCWFSYRNTLAYAAHAAAVAAHTPPPTAPTAGAEALLLE